jgi:DNA-binding MarR family transcriptional regulator
MPRKPAIRSTSATLSASEQSLWRGFLAWSEVVTALVGRDLFNATGLSRPDFEVLVRLYEAPGSTLTQRDLGESLGWSPSRLSHQLDRMEARDLVTRVDAGIGRLRDVGLTQDGAQEIGEAVRVHAAAVRAHFLGPLEDHEKQALTAVLLPLGLVGP